jgi:hypothetical protein
LKREDEGKRELYALIQDQLVIYSNAAYLFTFDINQRISNNFIKGHFYRRQLNQTNSEIIMTFQIKGKTYISLPIDLLSNSHPKP